MRTKSIRALLLILTLVTVAAGQSSARGLAGTTWRLIKIQDYDNNSYMPDDRSKYTITFGTNGRVSARVDCNRGGSSWKSNGPGQLQFGSWSMTRAKCAAGSLHDKIVMEGANVRSYELKDGRLYLSGMSAGGYYELEPLPAQRRRR